MKNLKNLAFSRMAALAASIMLLTGSAASMAGEDADDWRFGLSIYGWLPSLSGKMKYDIPESDDSVNVDIENILDALNMTFMASFEARKGAWAGFTDIIYLDLGQSGSKSASVPSGATHTLVDAHMDLKAWVWTLGGSYTVWGSQGSHLDLLAGARLLALDTNVELTGHGPLQRHRRLSKSIDLWDGIIGFKGRLALNERWFMPYYADVGAGDSDLTWQALGGIGYAFDWGDITLDYRHLDYDQADDKPLQDIAFSGAQMGVVFRF